MNTKNQTNLSQLVIGRYERFKNQKTKTKQNKNKQKPFPGMYAYQNVLLYTYLQHKPTWTHT